MAITEQEPLLERLSASPEAEDSKSSPKKRKRATEPEQPTSKRAAKKAKSKKSKADEDDDLDLEAGLNKSFAGMDHQLLADYVARQTRKFENELTEVELKDKYLPGEWQYFSQESCSDIINSKCHPRYNIVG